MATNPRFQKGFTLIEGLIAVLVLGYGFLSINKLQGTTLKSKSDSSQRSEASTMATAKMEQLRNFGTITDYTNMASGTDSLNGKNASYARAWTITNNANQKGVDLTINWTTSRNRGMNVHLTSMIAQVDPVLSGQVFALATTLPSPPQSINSNVPQGAVNNGNGTSDYTPSGSSVVVTYNNTTGNIVQIDHLTPYSIAGTITSANGKNSPGSVNYANVTVNASNNSKAFCVYANNSSSGNYTCYVNAQWSGSITLGGITNVEVCTNTTQPYGNLAASLTNQNYGLFNKTKACSGSTPTQYQLL